jgi:hypothetical protein
MRMARLAAFQGVGGVARIVGFGWDLEMQVARAANPDAGERPLIDVVGDVLPDIEAGGDALRRQPRPILPTELVGQSAYEAQRTARR